MIHLGYKTRFNNKILYFIKQNVDTFIHHEDRSDIEVDELSENLESLATADDEVAEDAELETIRLKPTEKKQGQFPVASRLRGVVQDLYETPVDALDALFYGYMQDNIPTSAIIFDPCCGNNAIVNYLKKKGYKNVIGKDKYTVAGQSFDFMFDTFPNCDVLVANFPFCLKHDGLELLVDKNILFMLLLPLQMMSTRRSGVKINSNISKLVIPSPAPKFIHNGKRIMVGAVGWFIGQRKAGANRKFGSGFETFIYPDRFGCDDSEDSIDEQALSDDDDQTICRRRRRYEALSLQWRSV